MHIGLWRPSISLKQCSFTYSSCLSQVGLSGVLLYAQTSLARELRDDELISRFVSEGRLLVVPWDLFRLSSLKSFRRSMKETRKAATGSSSAFHRKSRNGGPRSILIAEKEEEDGPEEVGAIEWLCGMFMVRFYMSGALVWTSSICDCS